MELLITFAAGLSILIGAAFIRLSKNTEPVENLSMAMALAALLALLFLDLLPDVRETAEGIGWAFAIAAVAGGVVLLKLLDHFVPDHEDNESNHDSENAVHIGLIAALAVVLHNIVEGMTVYSLSMNSLREGAIFAVGIALHNIPMGMLIESTMELDKPREHVLVLSAVTLSTLLGGIVMQMVKTHVNEAVTGVLVCAAAGMIIYITFLELLPHVLRTRDVPLNITGALLGFLLVLASSMLG
ncbi:MAG: ZIP family metal transporter [Anaerovoracaceae bacterium]|nr:ZIP family metal transporter [Bacillota bacterium]MDY2670944.1 ZIP family metal transporter [Anaerovoracaceae bacterium]